MLILFDKIWKSHDIAACTDQWITSNHGHNKGHQLLQLRINKKKRIQPSYIKGGGWLNHIGSSVSLCVGAILNHAPIGEYRKRFFPRSNLACPCGHNRVETRAHILNDCMVIKHFALFLTDNPGAFAQSSNLTWGAIMESPSTAPSFLFSSSFPLFSLLLCLDQLRVIWVLLYISC